MAEAAPLKKLPLDAVWRARTSKFADFAGYDMPIQFEGLIAEHKWTREHAGLFDVSHMGPCVLALSDRHHGLAFQERHEKIAALIERLVPADIAGLEPGQVRYTTLLNAEGGVLDDLMIARMEEVLNGGLYIVVNAGRKHEDWALIHDAIGDEARVRREDGDALLALQGPSAERVIRDVLGEAAPALGFMQYKTMAGAPFGVMRITRSGYTGEDGFEILVDASIDPANARGFAEALLAHPEVKPVGLGARDSLRLEAGLCLYGHDLDPTTSPIEAGLAWTIQKTRRERGDFPGAARILRELKDKPARKRVGILPKERAPAREGVEIFAGDRKIGVVTSGGFSPLLNAPISMGYVETAFAKVGTEVQLSIRGQMRAGEIAALPFVPHRYVRKP
ncbi:MAG: glycine cleavage system aminomethyltransferase GcvT [Hydrogenophilaceae bacterium]|jgi:aminomethyltransferase|nr:glycine cleavage system aminomethyltransferase GcvT [Hydrogenophilaceae bacterium]